MTQEIADISTHTLTTEPSFWTVIAPIYQIPLKTILTPSDEKCFCRRLNGEENLTFLNIHDLSTLVPQDKKALHSENILFSTDLYSSLSFQ